jgi:hypothetical protein
MKGVDFDQAVIALPTYCLALAGDVGPSGQQALALSISELRKADIQDSQKLVLLGLECINVFGESIVLAAIQEFGETMFIGPITQ